MDIKAIGEKIKQYRKLKGLTQEELAKNSGLSTMSIRRYESGERIAPQETLLKIAKALTIAYMELEKAMEQVANIARAGLIETANELEEFEDLERELKMLDRPTAWDRKKARERRRAAEREAASRFRQYKASEKAWSARKRTGPRRREWRGPWKEN